MGSTTNINATPQPCSKNLEIASDWKVSMPLYKLPTSKTICKAVCLPSKHWQFHDFSDMSVVLILVADPMFFRPIFS
jgi:hypothetical protein